MQYLILSLFLSSFKYAMVISSRARCDPKIKINYRVLSSKNLHCAMNKKYVIKEKILVF